MGANRRSDGQFTPKCDGSGWIIYNAIWPEGADPYQEKCGGCENCEAEPIARKVEP